MFLGGSCTYVGAQSLKEISKRTTFIRVTAQLNEIISGNPAPLAAPKSPHISPRLADDRLAHESPNLKRAKADWAQLSPILPSRISQSDRVHGSIRAAWLQ